MEENKIMKKQAKTCEIALICGSLQEKKVIDTGDRDLFDMYEEIYTPIYQEWENGIKNNIFKTTEEEGYISAYAQRRLKELYRVNK